MRRWGDEYSGASLLSDAEHERTRPSNIGRGGPRPPPLEDFPIDEVFQLGNRRSNVYGQGEQCESGVSADEQFISMILLVYARFIPDKLSVPDLVLRLRTLHVGQLRSIYLDLVERGYAEDVTNSALLKRMLGSRRVRDPPPAEVWSNISKAPPNA